MKQNLREQNKLIIDSLIKVGSNIEKLHGVEFAFYGNVIDLAKLKDYLLSIGFFEVINQSDNPEDLIVSKKMPIEIDLISNEELKMIDLAKEFCVNYDGWSTYPVK